MLLATVKWTGFDLECDSDQIQLSFVKSMIDTMVKITLCDPKRHVSVTNPAWHYLTHAFLTRVCQCIFFLEGLAHPERSSKLACWHEEAVSNLYKECRQQLWRLVHLHVAHHVPDKQLDVYAPIHNLLKPVLDDWCEVAGKLQPSDVLALALLQRAATDKSVWSGTVNYNTSDMSLDSSSLQWTTKQCSVAILWRAACKSIDLASVSHSAVKDFVAEQREPYYFECVYYTTKVICWFCRYLSVHSCFCLPLVIS